MKRVFTACSADIMDYEREFKYVTSIYFITQNSTSMIFFKKKNNETVKMPFLVKCWQVCAIIFPFQQIWFWIPWAHLPLPCNKTRCEAQLFCVFLHDVPSRRHLLVPSTWLGIFHTTACSRSCIWHPILQGHSILLLCADICICYL